MKHFAILVAAAALAGCAQNAESLQPASTSAPPFLVVVTLAPNGMEYDFNPEMLVVPIGREVRLTAINSGYLPHTYTVHDLHVDSGVLQPGERTTLTFAPAQAGSFEVMCDVGGHYEAGMKGTLVVRDA